MKPIFYVLFVLSLIISEGQTQEYRPKPDFSHPKAIWNKCGLRYQPFVFVIQYPNKCFTKPLADKTILDVRGRAVDDWQTVESRIGGGRDVTYRESPWTVQVLRIIDQTWTTAEVEPLCTGTLLNDNWILTAGHCFDKKPLLTFAAGSDDTIGRFRYNKRYEPKNWRSEYKHILHPDYPGDDAYDIALVRVDEPFDYGVNEGMEKFIINNVCLPTSDSVIPYNIQPFGTVFGFGAIGMDCDRPPYKLATKLQTADMFFNYCQRLTMFCADITDNRTCKGDSGSGLVQYTDKYRTRAVQMGTGRGTLIDTNTNETYATSFTFVHQFLDWIWKNIDK